MKSATSKRVLLGAVLLVFCLSPLLATGQPPAEEEVVDVDWFINLTWFNYAGVWGEDKFSLMVEDEFGLKLNFITPAQEGGAQINTMIAGGELPDLVTVESWLEYRRRMAHILSDGEPTVTTTSVADFLDRMTAWMRNEHPIVCGLHEGTMLDLASPETIVLLQPTRVVPRKRIPRDWDLIGALLRHPPFRDEFERRTDMTLVLLVTGPVPIEHRVDVEDVLHAFSNVLDSVPESIGVRIFQAFSVGTQGHPSLSEGLEIFDIYRLADMVVFPSETEGRGLPIPESAAAGIPIVCSRYDPVLVFDDVVGAGRPESDRIQYLEFPDSEFDDELLDEITAMLFDPASFADRTIHNQNAVHARFSLQDLQRAFTEYLLRLDSVHEPQTEGR